MKIAYRIKVIFGLSALSVPVILGAIFVSSVSAATYTVATTADAGAGILRQAVSDANATGVGDTIAFNLSPADPNCNVSGVCTIILTSGVITAQAAGGALVVANETGAGKLVISGNNLGGIFRVGAGADLTLDGITFNDGLDNSGTGALSNVNGTLTVSNSTLTQNSGSYVIYSRASPSGGVLNVVNTSISGNTATRFGLGPDKIVPADFDGDGNTDIAVFRDGAWYWLNSSNGGFGSTQFGQAGDLPVAADYTGDGRAEVAVFRGGVWYTFNLVNGNLQAMQFGITTDKPVPADYDGDGKTDCAVYRDGVWYMLRSSQGFAATQFGIASDRPTVAGFDGDGKADFAVFRDGVWYMLRTQQGFGAVQFGTVADRPVPAAFVPPL